MSRVVSRPEITRLDTTLVSGLGSGLGSDDAAGRSALGSGFGAAGGVATGASDGALGATAGAAAASTFEGAVSPADDVAADDVAADVVAADVVAALAVVFFAGAASSPSAASFLVDFLAALGSSGATSRTSPRSLAVCSIMSANTGCNELAGPFTGMVRLEARSTSSPLVMPSFLAKSLTLIFFSAIRLLVPHVIGRRAGFAFCHGRDRGGLFPDHTVTNLRVPQGFDEFGQRPGIGRSPPGARESPGATGRFGAVHRTHPRAPTRRRVRNPTRMHASGQSVRRMPSAASHAGAHRSRRRRQDGFS